MIVPSPTELIDAIPPEVTLGKRVDPLGVRLAPDGRRDVLERHRTEAGRVCEALGARPDRPVTVAVAFGVQKHVEPRGPLRLVQQRRASQHVVAPDLFQRLALHIGDARGFEATRCRGELGVSRLGFRSHDAQCARGIRRRLR